MRKYYTIYDKKSEKYYYIYWRTPTIHEGLDDAIGWTGSEFQAKWFATKTAARYAIKINEALKNNPNLCIKKVAEFFD